MYKIKNSLLVLSILFILALAPVVSAEENNSILFILGTDFNEVALNNATSNTNISEQLNITILNNAAETVPAGFNFSNYPVIFIESQPESTVNDWQANLSSNLTTAKDSGCQVMGYNLSSNITVANIDLYSSEYTDIERYWIQGSNTNMESMLKFMGQKFCGAWANESITEPELLHPEINIIFILNYETDNFYLTKVLGERSVITDRFNVTVMNGQEAAAANLTSTDLFDQDVIMLGMIGFDEFPKFKDALLAAKENGTQIGLIGNSVDIYGVSNLDMENSAMKDYHENGGYTNMENWIRCIGATLEDVYIEYSPVGLPPIPKHGIYHPDAFPRIFENSMEYLEWYADHGYNAAAPTIGIIATYHIEKNTLLHTTDDAIINNLESKGYNVIFSTYKVCTDDVDYFTQNGTILVDSIISLKSFHLNYGNQTGGVEYLKKYNVPVLKGVLDPYSTPDEYNASQRGLDLMSIAFQVTQPEIDGCIDYIWIAGGGLAV
jgi:cobaltochelatase CobN